jgi:hypothetical protein
VSIFSESKLKEKTVEVCGTQITIRELSLAETQTLLRLRQVAPGDATEFLIETTIVMIDGNAVTEEQLGKLKALPPRVGGQLIKEISTHIGDSVGPKAKS